MAPKAVLPIALQKVGGPFQRRLLVNLESNHPGAILYGVQWYHTHAHGMLYILARSSGLFRDAMGTDNVDQFSH
jgi:hypothetical protein